MSSLETQSRAALLIAVALFTAFAVNVLIGKLSIVNGASVPAGLSGIAQALLLFLSVCCFMAAALIRESHLSRCPQQDR